MRGRGEASENAQKSQAAAQFLLSQPEQLRYRTDLAGRARLRGSCFKQPEHALFRV